MPEAMSDMVAGQVPHWMLHCPRHTDYVTEPAWTKYSNLGYVIIFWESLLHNHFWPLDPFGVCVI